MAAEAANHDLLHGTIIHSALEESRHNVVLRHAVSIDTLERSDSPPLPDPRPQLGLWQKGVFLVSPAGLEPALEVFNPGPGSIKPDNPWIPAFAGMTVLGFCDSFNGIGNQKKDHRFGGIYFL